MKTSLRKITLLIGLTTMLSYTSSGQMKVHDDGDVTIGTLLQDGSWDMKVKSVSNVLNVESSKTGAWAYNTRLQVHNDDIVALVVKNGGSETIKLWGDGYLECDDLYESSDERFKTNIIPLNGSLDKIMKLQGVNYELKRDVRKGKHKRNLGLIAQEVQRVVPEVVRARGKNSDTLAIGYTRLVALLIEGMKEQQVMIEDLSSQVSQLNGLATITDSNGKRADLKNKSNLGQNIPNPGLRSTVIPVFIDGNESQGVVCFYDLTGKQVFKKEVRGNGQQNVEISVDELSSGKYLYSLIVNGKEVDTKSMILLD